jgi:hypothetical protein
VKIQSKLVLSFSGLLLSLSLAGFLVANVQNKRSNKDVCAETNPASICTASNRCGSNSNPCIVHLKRSGGTSATVTRAIPNSKSNAPFCVKVGTRVTWQSPAKNTGFILDLGPLLPLTPLARLSGDLTGRSPSSPNGQGATSSRWGHVLPGQSTECADRRTRKLSLRVAISG